MRADTVCLRCHQKCHLTVEVIDGRIVDVEDASINRTPPCSEACPIGTDVPGYVMAVSQGDLKEAMQIIRDTNPLPHVCARVCHHPCEMECNRNAVDEPIAIQRIKRLVTDYPLNFGEKPAPPERTKKEKVAIVGSGPAGLTAAHDLVKAGYGVTVYEAASVPGGMLTTVIPEFKLPKTTARVDIDYIKALGVQIKTNTPIGQKLTTDHLLQRYNAVLVSIGCWKPVPLNIPGSDLEGIHYALPWLRDAKQGRGTDFAGKVVIIGGGDTAMDAARTALRRGASEVHLTCLESRETLPAHVWEIEKAEEEGVKIHPSLAPQRFKRRDTKKVSGIDFSRVASTQMGTDGKVTWKLRGGPDSEFSMDADAVIVSIGQTTAISSLSGAGKLKVASRGTLKVDPETLASHIPGLFAAGDVVTGPSTVLACIAAGRKAASSIIEYLGGPTRKRLATREASPLQQEITRKITAQKLASQMPVSGAFEAVRHFHGVESCLRMGIEDAGRCLDCVTACTKGRTIPDVMYHPDRLKYPLRRRGERGEGQWERISWDEAIGTIAGKLKEIKERHGPEAIAVSCGSGQKHIAVQALAIAKRIWPTPNTHWGRYTCDTPDDMNNGVTFGDLITYEFGPDYAHSKCIVFWGSNPDVTTPAQTREVYRALRRGAKVMVIDPRPIPMTKRAELWLRIRPGTDAALALAMLNVIISEELFDREFVDKWCAGFDKLKEHIEAYPPERAAEITGLSKEDIVRAASMYATAKPGCIYVRLGAGGQQVTSTQTSRAISILVAVCGNVDVPGGNLLYYRTFRDQLFWHVYDMGKGIKGPAAIEEKRIGAKEYPLMHKEAVCDMPGLVRAMEDRRVKALWCVADNLIVAEMDSKKIWRLLKNKVDFTFVSDFFMTPTAELADIVLPAAFYTEIDTLAAAYLYPANYVTASRKVVEPLGECKDDREVAIEIAKRMGVDVNPWGSVKDFLDWRLKYLGVTFDELCDRQGSRMTFPREFRRYETSIPAFDTASGKVELYSTVLEAMGLDPLPVYQEPPESPVSTPELFEQYPLVYVHYRLPSYMHSEGRQIDRQRRLAPYPCLELNPRKASKLGIKDGDLVYLETPSSHGEWRLRYIARLVSEMHPDVIAGPHGWWFPEKPGPEHGCFDSNINAVLTLDPPYDPVVGNVQCRAILCRVQRAE